MRVSDALESLRSRPLPLLAALAGGLALGFLLALASGGGASSDPHAVATLVPPPTAVRPVAAPAAGAGAPESESAGAPAVAGAGQVAPAVASGSGDRGRAAVERALARGVQAAQRVAGPAEAAVWLDRWSTPVLAGDTTRSMRMWSMSKAVTAVAVLQRQPVPPPDLEQALVGALTRSENCAQRRVVMGLQQLAGGAEGARGAFLDVLARAGAHAEVSPPIAPPEASCRDYLQQHAGALGANALDPAYQYGTAMWTVGDAIDFAHALGGGAYSDAGARALDYLALPKAPSREPGAQLSTDPAWGVGRTFPTWEVAYKAGWGGSGTGSFLVGQIAVVRRGARWAAIAAMVHPTQQPSADDPGLAHAADGLEALLREIAAQLDRTVGAG